MSFLKEAYIGYQSSNDEKFGIKIKVLHTKLNPRNMNKLDHIHYVANGFTYMISLAAYHSDRMNKHIDRVIISDLQLADNIGCAKNYSKKVIDKMKAIFNLEIYRKKQRGGARVIVLNQRVIDFMKVYSEEQLHAFIDKYNIDDIDEFTALQQIFRYRAWGVKETQLRPSEKEAKNRFMRKYRNFFHRAITNNVTEQTRINTVNANRDKISDYNKKQLDRIIQEKQEGKLSHYWLNLLIRLEQKVTMIIESLKRKKKQQEEQKAQQNISRTNSESLQGETVAHEAATRNAQRVPEDLDPNDYIEVLVEWNNMISFNDIPNIEALNQNVINAINTQVNSIGKRELISCIRKITGLKSVSDGTFKMTFDKFMNGKTIKIIMDSDIQEDIDCSWLGEFIDPNSVPYINSSDVPSFSTIKEANTWWINNTTK